MQLIAVFRGYDGIIGQDVLDDIEITGATILGNRVNIWGNVGFDRPRVIAHAELRVVGRTALWHLYKGARGKEIGIATEVSFHV